MDKTIYIAKDGETLDKIVYQFYGTLDVFETVRTLNTDLKSILSIGDKVVLPKFEVKCEPEIEESKALW